jgi:hypothetical protein
MKTNNNESLEYFICSQEVVNAFPNSEHSKPFNQSHTRNPLSL